MPEGALPQKRAIAKSAGMVKELRKQLATNEAQEQEIKQLRAACESIYDQREAEIEELKQAKMDVQGALAEQVDVPPPAPNILHSPL